MKQHIIMALLVAGSAIALHAQQDNAKNPGIITVKGTIEGIESGKLHMLAQTGEQKIDTLGSCSFQAPNFVLKGITTEPMVTQIVVEGYQGGFRLLAEPGVTYEALLKDGAGSYIRGGRLQDEYEAHSAYTEEARKQLNELYKHAETLRSQGKYRSASQANDSLQKAEQAYRQRTQAFLAQHDDLISAYIYQSSAAMKDASLEESRQLYAALGPGAKATHCARLMKERIERMEKTAGGAVAPDFTLTDLNGKQVTMSQVPGKIKILDFWASWCGPCRMNNPALRKLYEEFHEKGLEIIGISLDDKQQAWNKAVEKDGLTWINVSSLKGWKCDVARLYNITGVPSIFVLDEQNHIIATNLRGEKLRTFLQERLK